MEVLAYLSAIIIGISLGLIGGGGSILTVPVLVYLMGLNPVISTAYSLFIVGFTSLVGSFKFAQRKLVSFKTAIIFGVPSMLTVFLTRKFLIPALPEIIFTLGSFTLTKGTLLLLLFAILMIVAAFSMINDKKEIKQDSEGRQSFNYPLIFLEGLLVGLLTGLVGAGGGFLIIPALVLLSKLNMKKAVGTSLLIIAAKSLFGFLGDIANYQVDWIFLTSFTAAAVVGIFAGQYLSTKIQGHHLKKGFGWFVLAMGLFIVLKEIFFV